MFQSGITAFRIPLWKFVSLLLPFYLPAQAENRKDGFLEFNFTAGACTTVTNTADAGPGSLRAAILCANVNPGPDTIRFNIPFRP